MGFFSAKLVDKVTQEFSTFKGIPEHKSPLKERIGEYWDFLGRPELDGADDVPWSAAFISNMARNSGADKLFPYSAQHSVYIYRTINDKVLKKPSAFWGFNLSEITIEPGDIIGMNRASAPAIDYDWARTHADYLSHADIVVSVDKKSVTAIGGNVGKAPGEIDEKIFDFTSAGLVNRRAKSQQVFVVIRNFLP